MYIGLVGDDNLVCVNRIQRGVLLRGRRILLDGRFCFGARRSRRCIFGRTRSTFFVGVGESVRPGVVFVCVSFEMGWALICCCCGGGAWSNLFLILMLVYAFMTALISSSLLTFFLYSLVSLSFSVVSVEAMDSQWMRATGMANGNDGGLNRE